MVSIILGVVALLGFLWFLYKKMSAPKKTDALVVIAPDEPDPGPYPDVDELNRKKKYPKL